MNEQAHNIINRYLAAELGQSVERPDEGEISRQRNAFIEHFGPEQLAKMSGQELMRQLPHNVLNEQPMDLWLDSKVDEKFNHRLFGSISDGSWAKFGPWQDKKTRSWRCKRPGSRGIINISEDEALKALEERRTEMLKAVKAIRVFHGTAAAEVDPQDFQSAIEEAAPRWNSSAWLHKYLHLVFPDLVTWNATQPWSEAALYLVGEVPKGAGLYALDIQITRYWNSLPALADLPPELRYRVAKGLSPREHWGLGLAGEVSAWREMHENKHLGLGPAKVGNLSEAIALNKPQDIKLAVETAFEDAALSSESAEAKSLIKLAYRLREGSIVALFSDAWTVVMVGEVTGAYRFAQGTDRPHQVPVRWYHNRSFGTSRLVQEAGTNLFMLEPTDGVVADIEGSLLINGVGPWPNFSTVVDTPSVPPPRPSAVCHEASTGSQLDPRPPLDSIARQVVEMLDRTLVPLFRERSLSTTIKVGFKVSKSSFTTSFIL